jgi:hypothetical protein
MNDCNIQIKLKKLLKLNTLIFLKIKIYYKSF